MDDTAPQAFYLPVSEGVFDSTLATESPWGDGQQHGGPPSALLARAVQRCAPGHRDGGTAMAVTRISIDFLGALPQGRVEVTAEVLRPGRRIELVEATMRSGGRAVAVARAWRTRVAEDAAVTVPVEPVPPPPLPGPQEQRYLRGVAPTWGYGRAVDWRFVKGSYDEPGPATVWARPLVPLVAGEATTGLQRTMIVADSANGVSAELVVSEWLFVPPTLTVTTYREATGEWILMDAVTAIAATGAGMAHAALADELGGFGVATQPLFVERR
ncbi:thioesterase family protein [Pseudonocardia sp. GCM10023141]|uniref:thioesterase family protein n=1 Tax=Pseudonocardia sp. GCM10023141 TaxID=3252653 RepID=UPI00361B7134